MLRKPVKPTMAKNYLSSILLKNNKMKDTSNAVKLRSRLTLMRKVRSLRKEA